MKSTLSALAAAVMAFGIMSCNNQPQGNDTKETARPAAATASAGSQQIAYVEIDSIMGQYKYWKEVTKILEAKEKNIQKNSRHCSRQPPTSNKMYRLTSSHRYKHNRFRLVFRDKPPMLKPCNNA